MNKLVLSITPALLFTSCADNEPAVADANAAGPTEEKKAKQVTVKPVDPANTIDAGISVGATAPADSVFRTKEGTSDLTTLLEDGPAVFIFTRSVAWCPFCQTQLKSVNAIVEDLDQRGYKLYGVSYDSTDEQDRFSMNQMLDYQMLSDEGSTVIDAFGLRDPQYTEGRAVGVPYASVIVINKEGKVIAKNVSGDYKMRPTNEQILSLVDSI